MNNKHLSTLSQTYEAACILLRMPLMPLHTFHQFIDAIAQQKMNGTDFFKNFYADKLIQESIYISSPDLYSQLGRFLEGKLTKQKAIRKLEESLYEYFARMCARCTPYGLLATCTHGRIAPEIDLAAATGTNIIRMARLDMTVLTELAHYLGTIPEIKVGLKYYPNSGMYQQGNFYRYTEFRYGSNNRKNHHIVKIPKNAALTSIIKLSREGVAYHQLIQFLADMGYERDESEQYIDSLIDNQVLVSELEPNVTGTFFFERVINLVNTLLPAQHAVTADINCIQERLNTINEASHPVQVYQEIYRLLKRHLPTLLEKNLIQIDSYRKSDACSLPMQVAQEITDALPVLNKLVTFDIRNNRINKFKQAFIERYEQQIVPLAEALDLDIGIGYNKSVDNSTSIPTASSHVSNYKINKFLEWYKTGEGSIKILDEEVSSFRPALNLPDSFGTLVSIAGNPAEYKILLRSMYGPSGANLLGRFAYMDQNLENDCTALCSREELLQPDCIFAEVVHLPQDRIGNIAYRPVLRKYEIPYLSHAALPSKYQINIQDLYLFVRNGHLVLYSRKLKKEIIPRLSSAHNFSKGLPLYNFLCDLQFQHATSFMFWDWGHLQDQRHLPRVEYKNVIVAPESWNLKKDMFRQIAEDDPEEVVIQKFQSVRETCKIPEYAFLVNSDHELLLNFTIPASITYLLKHLRQYGSCRLTELIWKDQEKDMTAISNGYTNEVIIPFIKKSGGKENRMNHNGSEKVVFHQNIPRQYHPGSEWLYIKLYLSTDAADFVLIHHIKPIIARLIKNKAIKKWFFIRYADPQPHIRVRLLLTTPDKISDILQLFALKLKSLLAAGEINNFQIDTYKREVERYGGKDIIEAEYLFCCCSNSICNLLSNTAIAENEELRLLSGILYVARLIEGFGLTGQQKIDFTAVNLRNYSMEFGLSNNTTLKDALSAFYRKHTKLIESLISGSLPATGFSANPTHQALTGIQDELVRFGQEVNNISRLLQKKNSKQQHQSWPVQLSSFVHMSANRFYKKDQRLAELKIYHFLNKLFTSTAVREKKMTV